MISKALNLLLVEDSETDAALMVRELSKSGFEVRAQRVYTADSMRDALMAGSWDLVISDNSMPSFDAMSALQVLKESGIEIPFIVVSGHIGDESAAAMMKAGASDYLIKGNLARLGPAVDRELREAGKRAVLKAAREDLRLSEERFRLFVNEVSDYAIIMLDTGGRVVAWNAGAERINGYQASEILGKPVTCFYTHEDLEADKPRQELRTAEARGRVEFEGWCVRKDGTKFWASFATIALRDQAGRLRGYSKITRDISEQIAAAAALKKSDEQYRLLFESNPQAMWVNDISTLQFLAVNEAATRKYGYSRDEFLAMTLADITLDQGGPAEAAAAISPAGGISHHVFAASVRKKDGSAVDVEIASHPIEFAGRDAHLALVHDVTARRQLEDQLKQSQKMEAVGRLAGGIAHDFNNLLTAIIGYSQILLSRLDQSDPMIREVEEIEKAGRRAAALTNQLLAFSRKQAVHPEAVDLNDIVLDLETMLRRIIGEEIELATRLEHGLGRVVADPNQIEQIIMNLVVNARDAMPAGGSLTISTAHASLDELRASQVDGASAGVYASLTVGDSGSGMDRHTLSHIFEPFFTTKDKGKGTGLGLSTVYGIVRQAGGYIEVSSEIGVGTSFTIYLPQIPD